MANTTFAFDDDDDDDFSNMSYLDDGSKVNLRGMYAYCPHPDCGPNKLMKMSKFGMKLENGIISRQSNCKYHRNQNNR